MADRKLQTGLKRTEKKFEEAAQSAAVAELLLPEDAGFVEAEGMEETFKFSQDELKVRSRSRALVFMCVSVWEETRAGGGALWEEGGKVKDTSA